MNNYIVLMNNYIVLMNNYIVLMKVFLGKCLELKLLLFPLLCKTPI